MNKLFLALFGIVGVVAQNGSSNANGSDSSQGPSSSGPTDPTEEDAATASATLFGNFTDPSIAAGKASFVMKATLTVTLPANVTSGELTGLTLPATLTASSTGAAGVAYAIEKVYDDLAKITDSGAVASLLNLIAPSTRRSLSERRRLTSAMEAHTKVTASSLALAKNLKYAAENDAAYTTTFETKMAEHGYTVTSATPSVSAKICTSTGCEDTDGVAADATTTSTTSDAIKTTMGVAVALVSGLFLF